MKFLKKFLAYYGLGFCLLMIGCTYDKMEDLKYQNWTSLNTNNSNLSTNNVSILKCDSKGNIWALCGNAGYKYLNKISPDLKIETYEIPFSDSIDLHKKSATALAIDKYDRIWVGALTSPIYCLENNRWKKIYSKTIAS